MIPAVTAGSRLGGADGRAWRMAESGYVQRGPGDDGRSTSVSLTGAGLTAAEAVTAAR